MASRVAAFMQAALFGCLAICASDASFAAPAAGDCLASPKGAAPPGERWYYRIERNTKRHCWYTRAATGREVAQKSPPAEPTPMDVSNNAPDAPLQPAVANARAEFAPPSAPPRSAVVAPANGPTGTDAPGPTLTERWPDSPNANEPNQPAQSPSRAAATQTADAEATPLWILLSIIGGVLALVGIVTALIKAFAGSARYVRPDARRTAPRWPTSDSADAMLADVDDAPLMNLNVPPMGWARIARDTAQQQDDEIEHLLSRQTRPAN